MEEISVRDVTRGNVEALCRICIPPDRWTDPIYTSGMELKRAWALEMLDRWGACAKLAYRGSAAAGMIQYWPVPDQCVIHIGCIYVPAERNWGRGIGTRLLSDLLEEAEGLTEWFEGEPPAALVTRTFPGERPGQLSARLFLQRKGFKLVGDDPDLLYYPLRPGFVYRPRQERGPSYVPQEEDKGKTVFIYGPSPCPYAYVFLKRAERIVREMAPWISIRWIDATAEPEEVEKRGGIRGCIVNAVPIKAFVLNEGAFKEEVVRALKA